MKLLDLPSYNIVLGSSNDNNFENRKKKVLSIRYEQISTMKSSSCIRKDIKINTSYIVLG